MPEALKDGTVTKNRYYPGCGARSARDRAIRLPRRPVKARGHRAAHRGNARIIERTGRKPAVLLKNDGGALPLSPLTSTTSSSSARPLAR